MQTCCNIKDYVTEYIKEAMSHSFIIQGIDSQGNIFRPMDWAERLAGRLSTVRMRRMVYSPFLYPTVHEGYRSLYVDGVLKESHSELYLDLCEFTEKHKLLSISIG